MNPRQATLSDVDAIAQMHVQCWQETYVGLLPNAEISKRDLTYRTDLWTRILNQRPKDVSIIDGVGFALIGPQRDDTLKQDYPRELQSLYVLRSAYGTGAGLALLSRAMHRDQTGVTTCVLKGNVRAIRFYIKSGGQYIKDVVDGVGYIDHVYGWSVPIQSKS